MRELKLPENVTRIIQTLEEHGYEAYAVGGCVRDSLLGREPNDWDITTSALPQEVKRLFRRTVDTGLQHGTVTVLMNRMTGQTDPDGAEDAAAEEAADGTEDAASGDAAGGATEAASDGAYIPVKKTEGYEVTTYRVDGVYEDGRHPKEVTFTASLEEDLKRRDFTINAMAYNSRTGIVDLFSGMEDLEQGVIRCVGDPLERFTEDALRILRAVRFSAQLGFPIEEKTRQALSVIAPNLAHVSAERIQAELVKLLVSPHPDYLRTAYETGITRIFFPEWDACMETPQNTPHHMFTVGEHILHSLLYVRPDKVLRLTMLLHDIAKPVVKKTDETGRDHFKMHGPEGEKMARTILRRLKFDNDTIATVCRLVKWHDDRPNPDKRSVRRAVNRIGEDLFPLYLEVRRADTLAQSMYHREEKLALLDGVEACYQEILQAKECVSLKTLAVTGRDLIDAGYQPGKELGNVLQKLLEHVLERPEDNQKETLLAQSMQWKKENSSGVSEA